MILVPLMLLASIALSALNPGVMMPPVKGETLSGHDAVLPDVAAGKIALIAMGFSYDSRFSVEAWTGRFRKEYGKNAAVTFYEVPMIDGVARLGKWFIQSGMRRGTARDDRENVVTVFGDGEAWKRRLSFTSADGAYLILIDRSGVVRWRYNGAMDESAYGELTRQMQELLSGSGKERR